MTRGPDEEADLRLVRELVFQPVDLALERFSVEEMQQGQTPDFRVMKDDELAAYCEVKSPRDDRIDNLLENAAPGEVVRVCGPDPTFNRIARLITGAVKQLEAVNADQAALNILILVNHDKASRFRDLQEVVTGHLIAEDGSVHELIPHVTRRLEGKVQVLDLIGWIDARGQRGPFWAYTEDKERRRRAFDLLRIQRR